LIDQYINNRSAEYQRLQEYSQVGRYEVTENQSKRQHQIEAEINQCEQLAKKKQNQLQQQASQARLIEHVIGNELHHLQNMNDQYEYNRVAEHQRLQQYSQVGLPPSDKSDFKLTNPQLFIQEAVEFLNADDPQEQK